MSSTGSNRLIPPEWLCPLLRLDPLAEGEKVVLGGGDDPVRGGILRENAANSDAPGQTSEAFGFRWHQRETFESESNLRHVRDAAKRQRQLRRLAECGLRRIAFGVGAVCRRAWTSAVSRRGHLLGRRCRRQRLSSVDVIFSEGVLHHTDSTRDALLALAQLLRSGGRLLFYVYRRKASIRELTGDYIPARLNNLDPTEAWAADLEIERENIQQSGITIVARKGGSTL